MKSQNKFTLTVISLFLLLFTVKQSFAQQSKDTERAEMIFNILKNTTWEDENNINSYTIGVFSSETLFNKLQKQAKTDKIKGKPVKVIRYSNYNNIQPNRIIYVSKNENAYLGFVYEKLKGKNVLIMSDRSKQPQYSIINFRKTSPNNPKPYDVNTRLAEQNNIILSKQVIRTGGTRVNIQKEYAEINESLQKANKTIGKKNKEIDSLKNIINQQEKRIKKLEANKK